MAKSTPSRLLEGIDILKYQKRRPFNRHIPLSPYDIKIVYGANFRDAYNTR